MADKVLLLGDRTSELDKKEDGKLFNCFVCPQEKKKQANDPSFLLAQERKKLLF
jgi:hypothetical protein